MADSGTLEDLVYGFQFRPTTRVSPTNLVVPDNPTMQTQVPDTAPDQSRPAEFDNMTYSMPNSWFFDSIPPEFRFVPTDEELVLFYLLPKLMNFPLPAHPIPKVNLYGHSPDYFADRYNDHGQKIWYFFTPRERKYPKGNRPNRAASDGYWKATGADKPIWSTNIIRSVGSKKSLAFFKGSPPNGKKTPWLMKEYTVGAPQPANQSMRLDDWVLCVIYKRPEKSNTRASVEATDQPSNIDIDVEANFDHQYQIGVDHETPTEVAELNFDEIYYLLNQ